MSGLFDQVVNYAPPLLTAGQVNYKGTWNAATNTPTLVSPPDALSKGDYYVVSAGGTQFSISFAVGDWIISNGTAWEKVDLTDAVSSVFGRTGAVVGDSTDYSAVGLTNTAIGAANPSTGAFTSLSSSSTTTLNGTTIPASKTLVVTTDKLSALAATTSAELAGVISDETGSGSLVFANSPTLVSPALGAATATSINGVTVTGTGTPALSVTGTTAVSGTNTGDQTITLTGGVTGSGTGSFAATVVTNANLTGAITSVGNATSLGSFTSANLASALTDETGSGANVFATSPTLVTPILGTPQSGTLTSCTGLPISTGVSGLGTGVATALAVNVGSAGAPVVNGGALGTPSSGTVTNLTGTASININGTVGATTPSTGAFTTLSASGVITGTATAGALSLSGATTANRRIDIGNTGQTTNIGVDSSTGGAAIAGGAAYSTFINSGAVGSPVQIGVNGVLIGSFSSTGLAVTGALSATGKITSTVARTDTKGAGGFTLSDVSIYNFRNDTSNALNIDYYNGATWSTPATVSANGLAVTGALSATGALAIGNTVNTVSPTSPNRTVTIVIGGTTYYLAAKTTND